MPLEPASIIFLDIDGVILPTRAYSLPENIAEVKAVGSMSFARPDRVALHPDAIAALIQVRDRHPDARLVLCTSWRHSVGVAETISCVARHGVDPAFWHEDPACPWVIPTEEAAALGATTASSKAADILAWLDKHRTSVTAWVVLDDDAELAQALRNSPMSGFVLPIDPVRGLTETDLSAISDALTREADLPLVRPIPLSITRQAGPILE